MKLMIQFVVIGIFIHCISCKASHNINAAAGIPSIPVKSVIIDRSLTKIMDTSHKIDTAFINGDTLTLIIYFTNFAKTDSIELISNGRFTKSNPPITAAFIRRKSLFNPMAKDTREIEFFEMKFDVSILKYPLLNKVILNLDEQYKITYSY